MSKKKQIFQVGDKVKLVHWGAGVGRGDLGKVVTIKARTSNYMVGVYGYIIEERIGNGEIGRGIGAHTFELVVPSYPNPPHKHAELIKAWADGAGIQIQADVWLDDSQPSWNQSRTYRIKPAKSAKDIKLEELEVKARELADEIKELRNA